VSDTLALEDLLDRVVDAETGILSYLAMLTAQPDEPPLFVGMAQYTDVRRLQPRQVSSREWERAARRRGEGLSAVSGGPIASNFSSGAGLTQDVALWATVGEACERYAMHYVAPADELFASEDELPGEPMACDELVLHSREQYARPGFPFAPYRRGARRHWAPGVDLSRKREVFVPVELFAGVHSGTNDAQMCMSYSTGCAAGPTYERALLGGLYEAVERDGFMFHWMTRVAPPALSPQRLRGLLPSRLDVLLDYPCVDIALRWLRTDVALPCVGCFVRPTHGRGFAVGAACHSDWRVAVEKALVEAFHTLNWTVDLDRWRKAPLPKNEVADFKDHVRFYLEPERQEDLQFLVNGNVDATDAFLAAFDGCTPTLAECVADLAALGYRTVAVDRTGEDLESVGIYVTHVIVPGLQPLHVGLGIEHCDTRRLETLCGKLGVRMPATLNMSPHPFP
jgi:ribosomal protein S12 methylthiotransferase accessory factor